MNIAERYLAYADDFELSFEDDDWTRLEQYFTEDATYQPDGSPDSEAAGRDALLARLKGGIDQFDRLMDTRALSFEAPTVDGDQVTVRWSGTYTKAGLPDVTISGRETASFRGDRIFLLADEFDPAAQKGIEEWLAQNGAKLMSGA
jgi:hypothetical protein